MTGDLWHRLAAEAEQLDAQAGRELRRALVRHAAPLRVQVAGRAGIGREAVEDGVRRALSRDKALSPDDSAGHLVLGVPVDTPDGPEPVLDADVVVYVVPRRLDPSVAHPADRAVLTAVDRRRVVLVVAGEADPAECAAVALGMGAAQERAVAAGDEHAVADAVAVCAATARDLRDEQLTRTAAGVAAVPRVRELVEHVLDLVGSTDAAGAR